MLTFNNRTGQSTVEYILLVTAVVAVMIVFATNNNSGFRGKMTNALDETTNDMIDIAGKLKSTYDPPVVDKGAPDKEPPEDFPTTQVIP